MSAIAKQITFFAALGPAGLKKKLCLGDKKLCLGDKKLCLGDNKLCL